MKKYYSEKFNDIDEINVCDFSDTQRRKQLCVETNRRRRDMALRIKRHIEKEEEHRRRVLKERKERHDILNKKLRSNRKRVEIDHKPQGIDELLRYIRSGSQNGSANAWEDVNLREQCQSPMARYSGVKNHNIAKISEHHLVTFESRLKQQETEFRNKLNAEAGDFTKDLESTVIGVSEIEKIPMDEEAVKPNDVAVKEEVILIENSEEISITEDSLDSQINTETPKPINGSKVEEITTKIDSDTTISDKANAIIPIKSILKKQPKFDSNPNLTEVDIRDSVEVLKMRNNKIRRSSSYSHGINDERIIMDNLEDESGRKNVRFADDPPQTRPLSTITFSERILQKNQMEKKPVFQDRTPTLNGNNKPAQKTITSVVPLSTSLKPPLHPRAPQDGSYFQASFKRPSQYQPPPKPQKISAHILDKEISTLISGTGYGNSPKRTNQMIADQRKANALDKTPTEAEIDQLWEEVRECLSKTRQQSKAGSIATVDPGSVRTADSGSDASIRSAPVWQKNPSRLLSAPFHVKHHGTVRPTLNSNGMPEKPLADRVIVHNTPPLRLPHTVSHEPLAIISDPASGVSNNEVSDSLDEFLAMESSCSSARQQYPHGNKEQQQQQQQQYRQLFQKSTQPNSAIERQNQTMKTRVFLNRPLSQNRPQLRPPSINSFYPKIQSERLNHVGQRSQLSVEEEKLKMSLDRLNEKLKKVTTLT